jgi:hypothetical protein
MLRRDLLKILAGVAALPIASKFMKGKGALKPAAKAVVKTLPKVSGMPEWFTPLVNKIIKNGDDISPEVKRLEDTVNVKKLKDGDTTFTLTEKPIDGEITITIDSPRNPHGQTVDLQYKKPKTDFDVETGKKIDEPGEFQVLETEPRWQRDQTLDIDERVTTIDKAAGDIEAAERTATGKIKDREKIKERRKTKDLMEKDPLDYLEREYGPEENLYQYEEFKGFIEPDYANGGIASFANGGKAKKINGKSPAEKPLDRYTPYTEQEILENLESKYPNFTPPQYDSYETMPIFPPKDVVPKGSIPVMPEPGDRRYYYDLADGGYVKTKLTKTVPPAKGPNSQGVESLFRRRYN